MKWVRHKRINSLIILRLKKGGGDGGENKKGKKEKAKKKKKEGRDQANDRHCYMDIPHKNNLGDERSQTQKTMYFMILFISNAEKEQIYREESRLLVGYPGLGMEMRPV